MGAEVARGVTACPGSRRRCFNRSHAAGEAGNQGLVQLKPSEEDLGSSKLKSFDVGASGPAEGRGTLESFTVVWSHNRLPKEPCKQP